MTEQRPCFVCGTDKIDRCQIIYYTNNKKYGYNSQDEQRNEKSARNVGRQREKRSGTDEKRTVCDAGTAERD